MLICTDVSERRAAMIEALNLDPIWDHKAIRILYYLAGEADSLQKAVPDAEATILEITKLRRQRPLQSDEQYQLTKAKVDKAEALLAGALFEEATDAAKKGELEL